MTIRRGRRAELIAGLSVLLVLTASVTTAGVRLSQGEPRTPEELLARARTFAAEHRTVAFRGSTRSETSMDFGFRGERVPPDQSTSMVSRGVLEGVAVEPDRVRVRLRSDGVIDEVIRVGDQAWLRFGESSSEVADRRWTELGHGTSFEDGLGGTQGLSATVSPAELDGTGVATLTKIIDRAVAPAVTLREGGETVVEAGLDLGGGEGRGSPFSIEQASITLALADQRRPVRLVVEIGLRFEAGEYLELFPPFGGTDGPSVRVRTEIEYSGWGDRVDVQPPAAVDVDRTPFVEEEAIEGFLDVQLYQPRGIPEGWVLDYADALPAEPELPGDFPGLEGPGLEGPGPDPFGHGCDMVEVDYVDPHDEVHGYLYLYQGDVACMDVSAPAGSRAFTAGTHRGWVEEDLEYGYVYAQIVVGDTVIEADTDLSPDSLAQVLSRLRGLDFRVDPEPIPGLTVLTGETS